MTEAPAIPTPAAGDGHINATELTALAHGLHDDPFSILGPHHGWVRVFVPGAKAVDVLDSDGTRTPLREQAQGLYVGQAPGARPGDGASYRLAIQWPGAEQVTADAYAFGALLDEAMPRSRIHIATGGTGTSSSGCFSSERRSARWEHRAPPLSSSVLRAVHGA